MANWKYPHIDNLLTMKPSPRILLGKRLYWTIKEDGSNIAIYLKNGEPHISSRNLEDAHMELETKVKETEDYPKIIELLKEYPSFMVYAEYCRKGRSVTGACEYDRNKLIVFDIKNMNTNKFLPYVLVYQNCYHHKIPVVELFGETRHTNIKDLLKFSNYALKHCQATSHEGMVIKTNPHKVSYPEFELDYLQSKVRLDYPVATVKRLAKGEIIYPEMPENEVWNCVDKAWQELGTEVFKDKSKSMPLIAKYVNIACKEHQFNCPSRHLYSFYQAYIERNLI